MATTTKLVDVLVDDLKPYEHNAKIHTPDQIEKLRASIEEFGFISPCLIDEELNIIAGHGRVMAAKAAGIETVPCVFIEGLTEAQRRAYILADNKLTELGEWDEGLIKWELAELDRQGFQIELVGFDGIEKKKPQATPEVAFQKLSDRFLIPPFTIMDARQKWWQDRKRAWRDLGIKSEIGRGQDGDTTKNGLTYAASHLPPSSYKQKNAIEASLGRELTWDEFLLNFPSAGMVNQSIFDPVVCEIAYRWYSKEGDRIIDPFAGGSVRGITAALLGRQYTGVDLSERQINANRENWKDIPHRRITDGAEAKEPEWIVGDSLNIDTLTNDTEFDFLFTCPPYADLEKYSDDPADLSNMDYQQFCTAYAAIIKKAVAKLKPNSFAVIVVGDIRDRSGFYRDFVSFTIKAFTDAGMGLYNEAILITQAGSLATVSGSQFEKSRKLGKQHQNVLVFLDENGEARRLDLASEKKQAEQIEEIISANNGKLTREHTKVLTFAQGSPKDRTNELGAVETAEDGLFTVII